MKMINFDQYKKFKVFLNRPCRAMILLNITSPFVISLNINTEVPYFAIIAWFQNVKHYVHIYINNLNVSI